MPCGHVYTCTKCGKKCKVCPICRAKPTNLKKIYLPYEKNSANVIVYKICGKNTLNCMFWPCGHVIVCQECTVNSKTCSICKNYKNVKPIFISI